MIEMLLDRPVIRETCSTVFGYELADVVERMVKA